jgi:hypothetical protein
MGEYDGNNCANSVLAWYDDFNNRLEIMKKTNGGINVKENA